MMNQVKRSGVVTKKRYDALVGLLKGVIAARPSIPWSALAGRDTKLVTTAHAGEVMGSISEAIKRIPRPCETLLLVLFAGLFLPVSAQSQELESLTATAKGQGMIASAVDERKITSALIVLRQNGTALIVIYADVQLRAEGAWLTSASSPEEILLKITGGVLKGEMTGSGKLLLTSDRKSFKELTMNVTLSDGQEVTVTFVADAAEPPK